MHGAADSWHGCRSFPRQRAADSASGHAPDIRCRPCASGRTFRRDGGDAAPRSALHSSLVEERSAVMTASPEIQEIAIVTGASTGIGAATARELARRGFHVLAGVRRDRDADAIRGPGIEPLIIDITNPDHIRALATRVHGDPQGRA